jgi:hypothetical protein
MHGAKGTYEFWREYAFKFGTGYPACSKLERHEIGTNLFRKNFHDVIV